MPEVHMTSPPVNRPEAIALPSPEARAHMVLTDGDRRDGCADMDKKHPKADRAALATITQQLAELEPMTVGELAERFREVFGFPTRTRNKAYLRKRVAWRIQELAEGGLSERALARIEELAPLAPVRWRPALPEIGQLHSRRPLPATRDPRLPAAGTVLVRAYKGKEHRVTVLDSGFQYDGSRYGTLSELAKLITGTPWNGYLFFGLQRRTGGGQPEEARA
jgi:hypothetical protein